MELAMQERKRPTMVKAQAYLKAGKTKKSAMLDDFLSSASPCSGLHLYDAHRHASTRLGCLRRYVV